MEIHRQSKVPLFKAPKVFPCAHEAEKSSTAPFSYLKSNLKKKKKKKKCCKHL